MGCAGKGCLLLIAVVVLLVVFSPKRDEQTPAPTPPVAAPPARPAAHVGDEVILELPGGKTVFLAIDDESYNAMLDAENRQDMEEMGILMSHNKVVRVPNGTRAKLIGSSMFSRKVRIRDEPFVGIEAWTQAEHVHSVAR